MPKRAGPPYPAHSETRPAAIYHRARSAAPKGDRAALLGGPTKRSQAAVCAPAFLRRPKSRLVSTKKSGTKKMASAVPVRVPKKVA